MLTCWPPGPEERENRQTSSASGRATAPRMTWGPDMPPMIPRPRPPVTSVSPLGTARRLRERAPDRHQDSAKKVKRAGTTRWPGHVEVDDGGSAPGRNRRGITDTHRGRTSGTTDPGSARFDEERDFPWL
ncbi:hypothetical protein GCM10009864_67540 [Streptomyces lunalinharesii]|uniref:Transposase n=1 Tax=Streptomyces lunalinharesii TaxID=333384 RepID=A0ABN3STE8_9ACTN